MSEYFSRFIAWASDPDNSFMVRTITALVAVPAAIFGGYQFVQLLRGRSPHNVMTIAAREQKETLRQQREILEQQRVIADEITDLAGKIAVMINELADAGTVPNKGEAMFRLQILIAAVKIQNREVVQPSLSAKSAELEPLRGLKSVLMEKVEVLSVDSAVVTDTRETIRDRLKHVSMELEGELREVRSLQKFEGQKNEPRLSDTDLIEPDGWRRQIRETRSVHILSALKLRTIDLN